MSAVIKENWKSELSYTLSKKKLLQSIFNVAKAILAPATILLAIDAGAAGAVCLSPSNCLVDYNGNTYKIAVEYGKYSDLVGLTPPHVKFAPWYEDTAAVNYFAEQTVALATAPYLNDVLPYSRFNGLTIFNKPWNEVILPENTPWPFLYPNGPVGPLFVVGDGVLDGEIFPGTTVPSFLTYEPGPGVFRQGWAGVDLVRGEVPYFYATALQAVPLVQYKFVTPPSGGIATQIVSNSNRAIFLDPKTIKLISNRNDQVIFQGGYVVPFTAGANGQYVIDNSLLPNLTLAANILDSNTPFESVESILQNTRKSKSHFPFLVDAEIYFNRLGIQYSEFYPNAKIVANFTPVASKFSGYIPLASLAKAMGYSSFNYVNEIVKSWKAENNLYGYYQGEVTPYIIDGKIVKKPLYDPVPGGNYFCGPNFQPNTSTIQSVCQPSTNSDGKIFYWNIPGFGGTDNHIYKIVTAQFSDRPLISQVLSPGDYIEYITSLVGIREDDLSYMHPDYIQGFKFSWRSNFSCKTSGCAKKLGRISFLQASDDFLDLSALDLTINDFQGGITILASSLDPTPSPTPTPKPVPEPAAVIGLGFIAGLGALMKRKYKGVVNLETVASSNGD